LQSGRRSSPALSSPATFSGTVSNLSAAPEQS
jgi:hypothetical protein